MPLYHRRLPVCRLGELPWLSFARLARLICRRHGGLPVPRSAPFSACRTSGISGPTATSTRTVSGAENVEAFVAEEAGSIVGSNFATRWGSFGFFGPLTIRPESWNGGCAQPLVGAVCGRLRAAGACSHAGLFTFAAEPQACASLRQVRLPPALSDRADARAGGRGGLPPAVRYSALSAGRPRARPRRPAVN